MSVALILIICFFISRIFKNIETMNDSNKETNFTSEHIWIIPQAAQIIHVSVMIWVIISFHFYKKTGKGDSRRRLLSQIFSVTISAFSIFLIFNQIIFLLYQIFRVQHHGDFACEVMIDLNTVLIIITGIPIFVFLYYQLSLIFREPILKHSNNFLFKFCNVLYIILISGAVLLFATARFLTNDFLMMPYGCSWNSGSKPDSVFLTSTCLFIASNILLYGLYAYTLYQLKLVKMNTEQTYGIGELIKKTDELHSNIKDAFITLTLSSIFYTITFIICEFVFPKPIPRIISHMLYNTSILVYIICIMRSLPGFRFNCRSNPPIPSQNYYFDRMFS